MTNPVFEQRTALEKQALMLASLILSYSPESAFANFAPTLYAMLFARALELMQTVGIVPEPNIRCWFWQLDTYMTGRKNDERIQAMREKSSPRLNYGLQQWGGIPSTGTS